MSAKVKREIKAMKELQHPHIIALYQVIDGPSDIFLVMELAQGGDLYEHLLERGCVNNNHEANNFSLLQFDDAKAKQLFRQLASAMVFTHEKRISHRDIKLENLLLDKDKQNLKIADFGLCNVMHDGVPLTTHCGSPDYAAPEIVQSLPYDGVKCDAWSCGIILYILLIGTLPFGNPEGNNSKMYDQIVRGEFDFPENIYVVPEAKDLIHKLLLPNPSDRMSLEHALMHPWLRWDHDATPLHMADFKLFMYSSKINFNPRQEQHLDQRAINYLTEIKDRCGIIQSDKTISQLIVGKVKFSFARNKELFNEFGQDAEAI